MAFAAGTHNETETKPTNQTKWFWCRSDPNSNHHVSNPVTSKASQAAKLAAPPPVNQPVGKLSLESRFPFAPTRPRCNSILHLFGAWLFDAALAGVKLHPSHAAPGDSACLECLCLFFGFALLCYCLVVGDADFLLFSVILGLIRSPPICFPFSVILCFLLFHLSLSELCLFLCSFSVRRHAHIDFQLFSQKSSGIPGLLQSLSLYLLILLCLCLSLLSFTLTLSLSLLPLYLLSVCLSFVVFLNTFCTANKNFSF